MKYRKKPVIIEAKKYTETNGKEVAEWCGGILGHRLVVKTLEGEMVADFGDYIIKGVKGEFYPCKPDIFEMTYDPYEE